MKHLILSISLIFIAMLGFHRNTSAQTTVTDFDGNTYKTVVINGKEWMAENLKVTHYSNGEAILTEQSAEQWKVATQGIWCNYDNDALNNDKYGKLYNWYAVSDARGLCPTGWHVPTDAEWQELVDFIDARAWGNRNSAGTKLKSKRQVNSPYGGEFSTTDHPRWDEHTNRNGSDDFEFNVLPGGYYSKSAAFAHMGGWAYLWSSTVSKNEQVWVRTLQHSNRGVSRVQYPKTLGLAVRCIKGDESATGLPQLNTLQPTDITTTSFRIGGEVILDGGDAVTERGLVYGISENPTTTLNLAKVISGSGVGEFTEEVTALTPNTTYWVRAYALNGKGTAYGIQKKVTTPATTGLPTLTTRAIASIKSTTAASGGNVTSGGGLLVTARGVVWSKTESPTLTENAGIVDAGEGTGAFFTQLTNLEPKTLYYVRAFATNSDGTAYGEELEFTTLEQDLTPYILTIEVNPTQGTATGAGEYLADTQVALTATPATGYQFVNWTAGGTEVSASASYTYTMPAENTTITANFGEISATLYDLTITVEPASSGTVSGAGSYEAGTEVALTATPATGYQFVNWTAGGTEVSTSASYIYTMPAENTTILANFELIPPTLYDLTIIVEPAASGTVTGAGSYEAGAEVALTATPATGYQFVNWTVGGTEVSTSASYTYTMPAANTAIVATFEAVAADGDPCPGTPTVSDFNGNLYNTVKIGGQCWIKENLRTTHYANGDAIPTNLSNAEWGAATAGAYAVYPNSSIDGLGSEGEVLEAYGALYNWGAVSDSRGLCPTGWHVPSDAEWTQLTNYITGINPTNIGNQLKSCKQVNHPSGAGCATSTHPRWNEDATHYGPNAYNFSALPSGFRDESGNYQLVGVVEFWWSSTQDDASKSWHREVAFNKGEVVRSRNGIKFGSSIRCVKD